MTDLTSSKRIWLQVTLVAVYFGAKFGIDKETIEALSLNLEAIYASGTVLVAWITKLMDEYKSNKNEAHWSFWDLFKVWKILK